MPITREVTYKILKRSIATESPWGRNFSNQACARVKAEFSHVTKRLIASKVYIKLYDLQPAMVPQLAAKLREILEADGALNVLVPSLPKRDYFDGSWREYRILVPVGSPDADPDEEPYY